MTMEINNYRKWNLHSVLTVSIMLYTSPVISIRVNWKKLYKFKKIVDWDDSDGFKCYVQMNVNHLDILVNL